MFHLDDNMLQRKSSKKILQEVHAADDAKDMSCKFVFQKYNLYILKGFRKLVIIFYFKNTPNLINLSLFLKHKNEVKIIN